MKKGESSAKKRLQVAFFKLLEETHYSKISVSELIKKAGVSRTTFYRHYVDILDMYNKVCEEIVDKLVSELIGIFRESDKELLSEYFEEFCGKIASQKKYITLLCGPNGDREIFEIGLKAIFGFTESCGENFTTQELFALKFISLAGIGSYVKSCMDCTEYSVEFLQLAKEVLDKAQERGHNHG